MALLVAPEIHILVLFRVCCAATLMPPLLLLLMSLLLLQQLACLLLGQVEQLHGVNNLGDLSVCNKREVRDGILED